jgi:hypothetical protein
MLCRAACATLQGDQTSSSGSAGNHTIAQSVECRVSWLRELDLSCPSLRRPPGKPPRSTNDEAHMVLEPCTKEGQLSKLRRTLSGYVFRTHTRNSFQDLDQFKMPYELPQSYTRQEWPELDTTDLAIALKPPSGALARLEPATVLLVANFCTSASRHALRCSAMWLRRLIPASQDDRLEYIADIRAERLCSTCSTSRETDGRTLRRYWCMPCQKEHPETLFSRSSLSMFLRPTHHTCIGREASIKLCAHKQLVWAELRAYHKRFDNMDPPIIKCEDSSHHRKTWEDAGVPFSMREALKPKAILQNDGKTLICIIEWALPILTLDQGQPVKRPLIQHALDQVVGTPDASYICPHVQLDDSRLVDLHDTVGCVILKYSKIHDRPYVLGPRFDRVERCGPLENRWPFVNRCCQPASQRTRCHSPQCDTTFILHRWLRPDGKTEVLVNCRRVIPVDKCPNSPQWLVSLDPASYIKSERSRHKTWCECRNCRTNHFLDPLLYQE